MENRRRALNCVLVIVLYFIAGKPILACVTAGLISSCGVRNPQYLLIINNVCVAVILAQLIGLDILGKLEIILMKISSFI